MKMRFKRFFIAVCAAFFCTMHAVPAQAYPLQWLDEAAKDAADNLGDAAKNIGDFLNCQVAIIKAPYCNQPPPPEPTPSVPSTLPLKPWFYHNTGRQPVNVCAAVATFDGANAGEVYGVGTATFDGSPVQYYSNQAAWGHGSGHVPTGGGVASGSCSGDTPNPDYTPPPSPSPSPSSPTGGGGATGGGSNPGEPGKWGDPSGGGGGGGNASPSPGASPGASPPQETNPNKASKFAKPNFVAYAVSVFSKKFPFDIFVSVAAPPPGGLTCPTYSFFEKPFELCIVKDMVAILKFPALLGFLVWCIMAI